MNENQINQLDLLANISKCCNLLASKKKKWKKSNTEKIVRKLTPVNVTLYS